MGASQAAQVLVTVKQQQRERERGALSQDERRQITDAIRRQYELEGSPYFSTARLWDDGIVDPADTRRLLGACLDIAMMIPPRESRPPVFRM